MKKFFNRNFHVVFAGLFFIMTGYLSIKAPLWADENVYIELAEHTRLNPFNPFNPSLGWIPHPPLGWYLFAAFIFMPRLASILTSAMCAVFLFLVSRKLFGEENAKISVVCLLSTWGFMLYSAITFLDGPLAAFMTLSTLSFLAWIKLGNHRYLLLSGLSLGIASLTKYTATPILLGTFALWVAFARKKISLTNLLRLTVVIAVSLMPLFIWVYGLWNYYGGNFIQKYSEIYNLFPNNAHSIGINLIVYAVNAVFLCGFPFLSWIRKRPFDSDVKLLIIYMLVLLFFFVLISPMQAIIYQYQNRYLLPIVSTTTVISAKSLAKETPTKRFIFLSIQFVAASLFAFLMLLYPPFLTLTSDLYSQLLKILGISAE